MGDNLTMNSVTMSNRTSDSTALTPDQIVEHINEAAAWINLLEANIVLLKAKIAKERESKKPVQSTFADTLIYSTFYNQVLELSTAIQNYKIRIQNETNKLFNAIAPGVMGQPLPNPEMENFRRQIIELGDKITPLQIIQMEMAENKEMLDIKLVEKQREMIKLIADVGDKMEQAESLTNSKSKKMKHDIQRSNERLMKVKISRCIINSILATSNIDFEENPDLLDLKMKWVHPISLKSETH